MDNTPGVPDNNSAVLARRLGGDAYEAAADIVAHENRSGAADNSLRQVR